MCSSRKEPLLNFHPFCHKERNKYLLIMKEQNLLLSGSHHNDAGSWHKKYNYHQIINFECFYACGKSTFKTTIKTKRRIILTNL